MRHSGFATSMLAFQSGGNHRNDCRCPCDSDERNKKTFSFLKRQRQSFQLSSSSSNDNGNDVSRVNGADGDEYKSFLQREQAESLEDLIAELDLDVNNADDDSDSHELRQHRHNDRDEDDEEFDEWLALLDDQELEALNDSSAISIYDDFDESNDDQNDVDDQTIQDLTDDNSSNDDDDDDDDTTLEDILRLFPDERADIDIDIDDDNIDATATLEKTNTMTTVATSTTPFAFTTTKQNKSPADLLELALQQEVVPAAAGVGSECLPGDFGFDPLNLATQDFPRQVQRALLSWLPGSESAATQDYNTPRPTALILRDYREAEIRHGRLAMLAAMIWPLQEMLDRFVLTDYQPGPLVYSTVTLPYFPLLMTLLMMLLGYLDIYSQAIKDRDDIGEAFLPGDCFWDPLAMLQGAPPSMKRNMQERELFNGRVAMLAVAVFFFEEATTHLPLIAIEGNDLLLEPAYTVPFIQEWLDVRFSPSFDALVDPSDMIISFFL